MVLCPLLYAALAVLNVGAALLVVLDKRRARRAARRVAERRFHRLALVGAWPAIFVAQLLVRHKTRKLGYHLRLEAAGLVGLVLWAALLHVAGCL